MACGLPEHDSVCSDGKVTIYNKIREKFKFSVPTLMHWINITVDSTDSALPSTDPCRHSKTICCQPNDLMQTIEPVEGSGSTCESEMIPTEICLYTKGDTVFRISDNVHQVEKNPGSVVLEVRIIIV